MVILSSTAFRGNVLYVQISSSDNYLGNIYAIASSPDALDPNYLSGGGGSGSSSGSMGGNIGGENSDPNTLYYSPQTIDMPKNMGNLSISGNQNPPPTLVSMVSSTITDKNSPTKIRHDLFLAYSSIGSATAPMLLRLSPYNMGLEWSFSQDIESSILSPVTASDTQMLSGQSGSISQMGLDTEGSAVLELYWDGTGQGGVSNSGTFQLQKVDVSHPDSSLGSSTPPPLTSLIWSKAIGSLDPAVTPRVLRFTDGGYYDGVVVGKCSTSSVSCLTFFSDNTLTMVITNTPFNPSYCLAAGGNSTIIMAGTSQTWTYNYPTTSDSIPPLNWNTFSNSGAAPSNILSCGIVGQSFYAIQGDDGSEPSVSVLSFKSSSNSYNWQATNMILTNGNCNSGGNACSVSGPRHKGPATSTIIVIVLVVLVVVLGAIFFCYRKRFVNPFSSDAKKKSAPRTIISPIPLQPVLPVTQQSSSSTAATGGGVLPSSSGPSWSSTGIPTSSPAQPPSTALYTNRNSLPMHPTTSYGQATISMPPQQSPIIASSLAAAPYRPFVIPSSPLPSQSEASTPLMRHNSAVPGDKREFGQGADGSISNDVDSSGSGSGSGEQQQQDSSTFRRSNPLYPTPEEEAARAQARNSSRPLQEVLSPTLANAQLILQQSQRPHQPRQQ
ncbi:hypothetical protein BGZ46_000719, partial [Entomortierella lignicola]